MFNAKGEHNMTTMNPVGWFDIHTSDLNRAVGFYETVLRLKLAPMGDPTGATRMTSFPADMGAYGAAGALSKSDHAKPGIGGTTVYFSVEDCATEEARVAKAGGKVVRPKFSIGEFGFVSLCQDTEGNLIGFNSLK